MLGMTDGMMPRVRVPESRSRLIFGFLSYVLGKDRMRRDDVYLCSMDRMRRRGHVKSCEVLIITTLMYLIFFLERARKNITKGVINVTEVPRVRKLRSNLPEGGWSHTCM